MAWDLYQSGGNFKVLLEFAVIGAITLAFAQSNQFSASSIVKTIAPASQQAQTPAVQRSVPAQTPVPELPFEKRTPAPSLRLAEVNAAYFEVVTDNQLRKSLIDSFNAYKARDYQKALQLLDSVDLNDRHVLLMRGLTLIAITGLSSFQSGLEMLTRASDRGEPRATLTLGILNLVGVAGLTRDPAKGRLLIEQAAATGDPVSIRALSEGYLAGWIGVADPAKAIALLRQTASAGDPNAHFRLAEHFFTGTGTPKNNAEAEIHMLKAAEAGHAEAQAMLGTWRLLNFGAGLTDDSQQALHWLEKAAAANEPNALYQLGLFYVEYAKRIGKADLARGVGYLKKCTEVTESADCAFAYAHALENGIGVDRNVVMAYAMYSISNNRAPAAKTNVRIMNLGTSMKSEELAEARSTIRLFNLKALQVKGIQPSQLPIFEQIQQQN